MAHLKKTHAATHEDTPSAQEHAPATPATPTHTRELPVLQETAAVLQHTTRELPMLQHDAPVPHTNTRALPMLQHNAPELQQEAREQDHSKDELLAGTFQHMCALFCCVLIFPFCL